MRLRSVLAVCFLVALIGVGGVGLAPDAAAAATCNTFDSNNTPATAFRGGDKIVVRGTGFAANSVVRVELQQGDRTTDLDRVRANDLGAFALPDATVPVSVTEGDAVIRALDARASATCAITLSPSESSDSSLGGLFLVWGLVLAAFGGVLAMLTYRRWKADRLREAVDSLARREGLEIGGPKGGAREPVAVSARVARRGERAPVQATDPMPSWVPEEPASPWATDEPLASWVQPPSEREAQPETSVALDELRGEVTRAWAREDDPPSPWSTPVPGDDAVSHEDEAARSSAPEPDAVLPSRGTPEPPVPQRPLPVAPARGEAWSREDDDLSPFGAPRPFDDRFAVADDPPPVFVPDDPARVFVPEYRAPDVDDAPDDELSPFRPASFDENVVADRDDESLAPPYGSQGAETRAPVAGAETRAATVEPEPQVPIVEAEPFRAPPAPLPSAPGPAPSPEPTEPTPQSVPSAPRPTGAVVPSAPSVPPAPTVASAPSVPDAEAERDFARALREFLDREDMERGRSHPPEPGARSTAPVPLPDTAPRTLERREPFRPVAPRTDEPPVVEPPGPRPAPVRPATPVVPIAPAHAPSAPASPDARAPDLEPPSRAQPAAPPHTAEQPWTPPSPAERPGSRPVRRTERSLQPGPMPPVPRRPSPQAPRAAETPQRRAPDRPGAEPPAYEPVRQTGADEARREPVSPWVAPDRTDPGSPPGTGRPAGPSTDGPLTEPPVLPVGWDEGRLKPPRTASDAIARLRREVRNWREERRT